ncbi:MAG: hypothetical protein K2J38_04690 [Muribaculaceae bacterium]|nr:hypothetical protein [Muribaculaceae bacterium]
MKRTVLALLAAVAICQVFSAQRTTRKGLRPVTDAADSAAEATSGTAAYDTIAAPELHTVDINGYDKPLRSRYETFFVSNNTANPVAALSLTISYYNTSGELLHRAPHRVSVDIPAGETRQVSLRSWDKQFAFYYKRSTVPARAGTATPYEIAMTVDTVFTERMPAPVK